MKAFMKVEFTPDDVRETLVAAVVAKYGKAPDGMQYEASARYTTVPGIVVEAIEVEEPAKAENEEEAK